MCSEFEDVLKILKWPFIVSTVKKLPVHNMDDANEKLDFLFSQLLQLQLPYPFK